MKSRNGRPINGILALAYRDERMGVEWRPVVQEYCFLSVNQKRKL